MSRFVKLKASGKYRNHCYSGDYVKEKYIKH